MGSPVSVVVANLVMEDVEERALATFLSSPRFWKRYVDDKCSALPRSLVDQFHKHLNSLEPCIQFSVESESEDRRLPFLDVQLCRDTDGTISTSVYRKSTHTNQYLSFVLHHPTAHNVALVRTLMSRASALSSSGVERVEEEVKIVEALKENGYPSSFILKHSGPSGTRQETSVPRPPRSIVTLPYIKGLSETVRRILAPLDIKVVFHPLNTLCSLLVHPKDPVSMDQHKGVVYQIPCGGCPKVYVGQTGRTLKHRLTEHCRALYIGDVASSAVAEHALSTGYPVDLSQSEVIDSQPFSPHAACWRAGTSSATQRPSTEGKGPFLRCTQLFWITSELGCMYCNPLLPLSYWC